jgi:hypothetical protein
MNDNITRQHKSFIDRNKEHSAIITTLNNATNDELLQCRWIMGILEQVEFANAEVLSDFKLELRIIKRGSNGAGSSNGHDVT